MKADRRAREQFGRRAEFLAALWFRLHGWRICAERVRVGSGEIDLIARRRGVVAFIEVKTRATLEAAQASISDDQRMRIGNAAEAWLSKHAPYQNHDLGFDIIFVVPGRWPQHLKNALI